MNLIERTVFILRFLPVELPSRKKDSELISLLRSIPYAITGIAVLVIASAASPAVRHLPTIWLSNLKLLADPFQKILDTLLTLVWLWFAAYAIGVLIIEKLRPYYRQYVVRPIERAF